jgi:ParB-like chromosome segregation protein Spo0J
MSVEPSSIHTRSIDSLPTNTLPFGSLYLSPFNVRKETDDPELPELIASIKAHGVLHDLVVHPELLAPE